MTKRTTVACLLAILIVVGACAPVSPTPLPTRTPKPTFTASAGMTALAPVPTETSRAISQAELSATPSSEMAGTGSTTPSPLATAAAGQTVAATTTPSAMPTATATVTWTPTATAEPSATPTATHTPSPTPEPTATAIPTATALPCPAGYTLHIHESPGFSMCYPEGWLVSDYEDAEQSAKGVSFDAPASDRVTGVNLQFFTVQVAPNVTGLQGQDYLQATGTALINRYREVLVGWPYTLTADGQAAVEIAYEAALPYANEMVAVLGWKTVALVDGQEWTIELVGRGEYREALEVLHTSVLESLRFLSLHSGG